MIIAVRESRSPLGFATKGGGSWAIWDRYITIDGQEAFHVGNVCGTCAFFFQRLGGDWTNASLSPRDLQDQLSAGVGDLTAEHAALLSELLPVGDYDLRLLSTAPRLVAPGDRDDYFCREQPELWGTDGVSQSPHDPGMKYYRGLDRSLGSGAHLYEFLVPMFPETRLDAQRVASFEAAIREGSRPTAMAISLLDIKGPAMWDESPAITSHWCLTHYIIDGHHKVFAAHRANRPIGLISMLAVQQGISSPDDHRRLWGLP